MAELVYSVVMAPDSVEIKPTSSSAASTSCSTCRCAAGSSETAGQPPEVIIATGLIEGTDGTGAKISKSKGNYVGLAFEAKTFSASSCPPPTVFSPTTCARSLS